MEASSPDARQEIRAALAATRSRRAKLFLGLTLAAFGLALFAMMSAPPAGALPRDLRFPLSLSLLLAAILLSGSVAIGFPLWSRGGVIAVAGIGSLAAVAGAIATAHGQPSGEGLGLGCLAFGGGVGIGVFAALRWVSGPLWRRFPDSTWCASVLGAGAAFTVLAAHCGRSDIVHLALAHLPVLAVVVLVVAVVLRGREDALR